MYLKRLELQGFKSFPDKISLNFKEGITAIVGPNGSGKSNISDSIRWVLGEQSIKSLRGSKMEDVIFAGTSNRKQLGLSEVSLIIDNQDKILPLDYSEIKITRRIYRLSEAEYLINGTSCRLKDVHELFMDTGLGKEGYSIIGQGKIDDILNSKSSDKRLIFDEATGIVKYRTRRLETLIKLEKEKQNLLRVSDIIFELEQNLKPLKTASEIAKNYLALTEQFKLVKINIFLIDAEKTEQQINDMKKNILNIQSELNDNENKKHYIDNKIIKTKNDFNKLEENQTNVLNELAELRSKIEQKENDIKLFEQKSISNKNQIDSIKNNIEKEKENKTKFVSEKSLNDAKYIELNAKLEQSKLNLSQNEKSFDSLNITLGVQNEVKEKFNATILDFYQKESSLKNELTNLTSTYEKAENDKEVIMLDISNTQKNIELCNDNLNTLQTEFDLLNTDINNTNKQIQFESEKVAKLNLAYKDLSRKLNDLSYNYNDNFSKYKLLKELEDDFEGYYKSVKAVLVAKKSDPNFNKINGALNELISVKENFETAIEIALGSYLQNIVVEDEQMAKLAIDFLKKTKQGRATFLPITLIKPKKLENKLDILKYKGVLGIADDLVFTDIKYKNIISNILGKTVICDVIENALDFNKSFKNSLKIVTLDGDLLSIGGALTGGSISKKTTSIFGRAKQLELLLQTTTNQSLELQNLQKKRSDLITEIANITKSIEHKKIYVQDKLNENITLQNNINNEKLKINELDIKLNNLNKQDCTLMDLIVDSNKKIREVSLDIENISKNITSTKIDLKTYMDSIEQDEKQKEFQINEITNIKIEISTCIENIKSVTENITRLNTQINNFDIMHLELLENIQKLTTEIKQYHLQNEQSRQEIKRLKQVQSKYQTNVTDIKNNIIFLNNKIENLNKDNINIIEHISLIEKEKTKLELKLEQIELDRRKLFDYMWDEYELTFNQAQKYEKLNDSIQTLYKKETSLKTSIKLLGIVNVSAIEDYKATKEKYDFLQSQKNDILMAEEKLKEVIQKLTNLMSEQFFTQFKLISDNFGYVFKKIFEGGDAYLKLTDESNVLESSVLIIARPPGKNLQNMSLLSGGEKALTAISLLFGILKLKPSPFCILDEIEATLDEANVKRFADFLKDFSKEIQFIVITHRKQTMECADILYGVTMQEQGISKLVSVEFKD